jgi:Zn-dependent peptidase ImmA (M78 family)
MRKHSGQWTIEVNSGRHLHAQRFTIAHELGHHVMGHDSCGSVDLHERQANVFAAELLIPLSFLRGALKELRWLGELSQLFLVSKEAMQYKLNERGLLLTLRGFD